MNPTPLILPVGTQVVAQADVWNATDELACPKGTVGTIVRAPTDPSHPYRVRLPNGAEVSLRRSDLSIRKHFQREGMEPEANAFADLDLHDYVIYRCITGSRAYGLDDEGSDIDRRGIYLPPAAAHWSLYGVPEQLEKPETEEAYWEIRKFLILALKANPTILECLYSPLVETTTPIAEELLAMRASFLSRLVYQTYNGYVLSQFKRMEADLRNRGAIKWKHAMHLIRLLWSGMIALNEGVIPVRVEDGLRGRLLAIKRGELPWEEVDSWRLSLHRQFDLAHESTRLPERPDYERANALLIRARRSRVDDAD